MSVRLINFDTRLRQAVRQFWRSRQSASEKQASSGSPDHGNRGAVTAGKNMDGFREMVIDVIRRYGPPEGEIHRDKTLVVLPGFFRPTKQWDLLLLCRGRLLAAIELKSLCGPSFGNNANNRCEEAIGSGCDFRKAQSERLFGAGANAFLGYFILVEDAEGSRVAVTAKSPHFPADPAFRGASYQERMRILCERLVEQSMYTACSVLSAPKATSLGNWKDLSQATSFRAFLVRLAGYLAGERDATTTPTGERRVLEGSDDYRAGGFLAGEWFRDADPG